jgi:PAS domain S-box-containing protein
VWAVLSLPSPAAKGRKGDEMSVAKDAKDHDTSATSGGSFGGSIEERHGLGEKRARSMAEKVAAARAALEQSGVGRGGARAAGAAIWHWDLAGDRVEWNGGLQALFGYSEKVTDAAWRESRIHPEDRNRVKASLQQATIVNDGAQWSDQYRLCRADGAYATVTDRAYVIQDDAGPRGVVGAITPTSPEGTGATAEESPKQPRQT